MAEQLRLARRCDFATADISSINLLNASGIEISENGWQPQVVPQGENEVEESMTFVVNSTSGDTAATAIRAVYQKVNECKWSKDASERYQVYLIDQLSDETNARQAVVRSMEFAPGVSLHDYYPVRNSHSWKGAQLGLVRGHWESDTPGTISISNYLINGPVQCGTIVGDTSARLAYISFTAGTAGGAISEFWWGFKSYRHGTPYNVTSPWHLVDGTPGTDSSIVADAPTFGGSALLTTFATNTAMTSRISLTAYQLSNANYEDFRGSYRLLARMKVDAGLGIRARVVYGQSNSGTVTGAAAKVYNESIIVTGTDWYLYDMGVVTFPCGGAIPPTYSAMRNSTVWLEAQLTSGTAAGTTGLHTDCFLPVSADEGCGHAKSCSGVKGEIFCNALGHVSSIDYTGTINTGALDTTGTDANDCVAPVGESNYLMFAFQRAGSSVVTDTVTISAKTFNRWSALRGNK